MIVFAYQHAALYNCKSARLSKAHNSVYPRTACSTSAQFHKPLFLSERTLYSSKSSVKVSVQSICPVINISQHSWFTLLTERSRPYSWNRRVSFTQEYSISRPRVKNSHKKVERESSSGNITVLLCLWYKRHKSYAELIVLRIQQCFLGWGTWKCTAF